MDDDGDVNDCLRQQFDAACQKVRSDGSTLSEDNLLYFYSRYKQAVEGPCQIPKPSFFDFQGSRKWKAWKELAAMSSHQAMVEYIQHVEKLFGSSDITTSAADADKSPSFMGIGVSRPLFVDDDQLTADSNVYPDQPLYANAFNAVKIGDVHQLQEVIGAIKKSNCLREANLTSIRDSNQLTLLHWAVDRGHFDCVKLLLADDGGVELANSVDNEGSTPLHYAVACERAEIIPVLLKHGAKLTAVDADGLLPIDLSEKEEIRVLLNVAFNA